jgi:hypothetical protein
MKRYFGALLFASVLLAGSANAQLAFSSFGPGDTYNTGSGATISGATSIPGPWTQASQFTSAATGIVDVVRVATFFVTGNGNTNIQLLNDNNDLIGNWFLGFGYTDTESNSHIHSATNPFDNVVLNAGQKYWMRMYTDDPDGWFAWNYSTTTNGRVAFSQDGGSNWSYADNATLMAFDVNLRPVPEPASMAALGLGVVGLLARRRKKA